MLRRLVMMGVLLGLAGPAAGETVRAGEVVVHDPWVRASLGAAPNSAAYMRIEVTGGTGDRLVGGTTPVADRVALHGHRMDGDIARMRPVEAIEVLPDAPVVLEPGGLHVMLVGLKDRLEEGGSVPLTLTFEGAGEVELELPVRGMAAGMRHGDHVTR